MARFVYKAHMWLATAAGLFTLVWFVSGIVMVLPANLLTKPASQRAAKEEGPSFSEIRISIPQAIAAEKLQVTSVATKRLLGRVFYQITTWTGGTHLIDAMDGMPFDIDAQVARRIALSGGADKNRLGDAVLLRKHDSEYLYGPLPTYKIAANDDRGTIYFVTVDSGELRSTNRLGRVRGFIAGLHTFDFLRPIAGARVARAMMLLFALLGTAMSLFGAWILWMQFRNWRQMRRLSA